MNRAPFDSEKLAKLTHDFLLTPLGKYYLEQLSLTYNAWHQAAESESLTTEAKARTIDRAAGLRFAIDWLTSKNKLLEQGYFDKEKPAEQ